MGKSWSDTLSLGKYTLKNRVFMSSLTRCRCSPADGIPNELLVEYYSQRAGAAVILTEAVAYSKRGQGFPGAACLINNEQAEGWKKVIQAVHKKGALIFAQIFHAGRVTHQKLNGGQEPWAPSAIAIKEPIKQLGNIDYPVPKAMTLEDIETVKGQFETSVKLAVKAGFDGIVLHGAFGYLIDEFLRSGSNQRTDKYGGSHINRCRLPLQMIDIALKHFQPYQIGIKLSPTVRIKDMYDQNPVQTYSYLLQQLSDRKIGFAELVQVDSKYKSESDPIDDVAKTLRPHFKGLIVGNYGFDAQSGLAKLQSQSTDAISYGRFYISNPDLAERLIAGIQINKNIDYSTLFLNPDKPLSEGYINYPFYQKK